MSEETEIADEAYTKVIELCATVVCSKMDEVGAENYITHSLETECGRGVEVTVRFTDGITPAEKLGVAEQRIAQLEEVVEAVAQFGYWVHWDCPVQSHIDKARELCNSKAKLPAKEQGS